MGKDINFLYMTINELIVFTYFYRQYLTNKKYENNHFIFEHIFNKIIINLSIIEEITDKDKEYLKDIKQEEAICLSLICLILINDKILFNKLPLFYKDLLNKIKKEDFIKLNNTVLFNLNNNETIAGTIFNGVSDGSKTQYPYYAAFGLLFSFILAPTILYIRKVISKKYSDTDC